MKLLSDADQLDWNHLKLNRNISVFPQTQPHAALFCSDNLQIDVKMTSSPSLSLCTVYVVQVILNPTGGSIWCWSANATLKLQSCEIFDLNLHRAAIRPFTGQKHTMLSTDGSFCWVLPGGWAASAWSVATGKTEAVTRHSIPSKREKMDYSCIEPFFTLTIMHTFMNPSVYCWGGFEFIITTLILVVENQADFHIMQKKSGCITIYDLEMKVCFRTTD